VMQYSTPAYQRTTAQLQQSQANSQGGHHNWNLEDLTAMYAQHQVALFGMRRLHSSPQSSSASRTAAVGHDDQQYASDHSADKRHTKRKRNKAKASSSDTISARPSVSQSLQPRSAHIHEWNPVDPAMFEYSSSEEDEELPYRPNPNIMRPAERQPLPVPRSSPQQPLRRRLPQENNSRLNPQPAHTAPPPPSIISQRRSNRGTSTADPAIESNLKTNR
jgi:hypothetical protein